MKSGYCTITLNGRDRGASEINHHQPHQRPVFVQRRWCCVYGGIGRESSIMSSFWKTKRLIPTSIAPNETNWKQHSTTRRKVSRISQKKRIIFHQDNTRPHVSLMTRQNCYSLAGKFWFIRCIHQTLHLRISIYVGLYKMLLMEKNSIPWKTVKGIWNSSLLKKIKSFGKIELWSCLKNEDSGTKRWICCSIKFWVKMKNVSFVFT